MAEIPTVTLNTGQTLPMIGLGTYAGPTEDLQSASKPWILSALQVGYRHIDTAYSYHTEKYVGKAVRESGIPREQLFITTKLPNNHHGCVKESLDMSLKDSGLDYFDLYLMHWPMAFELDAEYPDPVNDGHFKVLDHPDFVETWIEMEELVDTGKVKAIGVSNLSVKTLELLLKTAKVVPAVNQVEIHPLCAQFELQKYCESKGVHVIGYSATGYAPTQNHPEVKKIAEKHNTSPAQVSLSWVISRGITVLPKSTSVDRQRSNLLLPTLDEEDVKTLNTLNQSKHLCEYPGPLTYGWTYEQLGW
ncbi:Aldo/keto reductase [Dacryopinax primogenitus]|uniref:Aldo/keto reductase n=1 Tax=Dacryopinax primogenitus (strain DJM 731) TaxID=1858805 RepID=M5GAN5_DACPD|nr:Aldo/keto reductase [Dacryopinax primogenitus]EJU00983.1 Aldo/keto reductase [Dacryopinax primogenitus]